VIPSSTEEDQLGVDKCGVLHFGGIQRLACRAIAASAELLVLISVEQLRQNYADRE